MDKRIVSFLVASSEFRHHPNCQSQKYVIDVVSGKAYGLGDKCMYLGDRMFVVGDDNKSLKELKRSDYVLCYGVGLTNIVSVLHNIGIKVSVITTGVGTDGKRNYSLFYSLPFEDYDKSIPFEHDLDIEDFFKTELGNLILEQYGLKQA